MNFSERYKIGSFGWSFIVHNQLTTFLAHKDILQFRLGAVSFAEVLNICCHGTNGNLPPRSGKLRTQQYLNV